MRKVLSLSLIFALIVGVFSIGVLADYDKSKDPNNPPVVEENNKATVSYEVERWLIFSLTSGTNVDFGTLPKNGNSSGEYTDPNGGPTWYTIKTNWQEKVELAAATTHDSYGDAQLYINEQYSSGDGYSYNYNPGFKSVTSSSWRTLARYNHSGDFYNWSQRNSSNKLRGTFNYKLDLDSGAEMGEYQVQVRYKATCM